jgi:hypothetical protein
MDQQQILNATITIEEIVDKGKKISIKGNSGRVHTYSIWKTKQDGSDSATYSQFKNMGLHVGSTVMVGYVIDEYDTEINGVPKRIQSKKIINFRETNETPSQTASRQESSNLGHSGASQRGSSDAFGRRLGVQGHINALLSNPNYYSPVGDTMLSIPDLVREAIAVENEAEKQLLPEAIRPTNLTEDLPVIQQDEVDVSDIPF